MKNRMHWWFAGMSPARDASLLIRRRDVAGAHVETFRRLVRIGPFGIYLFRYKPGTVDK